MGKLTLVFCVVATSLGVGCDARTDKDSRHDSAEAKPSSAASADRAPPEASSPRLLYLPERDDVALGSPFLGPSRTAASDPVPGTLRCPKEMVDVRDAFCIDRYEAHLVDAGSRRPLSPYYPPDISQARRLREHWLRESRNAPSALGRDLELPPLDESEAYASASPLAVSAGGEIPSGYLDGAVAERACTNAGKRLCKPSEWVTACRGESNRQFPYGETYLAGACNVFRESHPAQLLHGNASEGHLDPRLNLVEGPSGPLLRRTGATTTCRSIWGQDAIYDMVGNLDEWVQDDNGAFQGGFYARATKLGCDARITSHPRAYKDYSLGVRCCK